MDTMKINGYGCTIEWDGTTLRAKGTNKVTHRALMGQSDIPHEQVEGMTAAEAARAVAEIPDELVLTRDQFTIEKFKTANVAINGNLVVRARTGRKYQLHFRRKHNADFERLHQSLSA